jgi:dolichol-phosphate mannosyltransferase
MNSLQLSVVMPARNEAANIERTVRELTAVLAAEGVPYEVIAVDDSSDDGTAGVLRALADENPAVRPVHRSPPGGFGRAVRAGLEAAAGDVVVIVMADASDDPRDVVRYYRKIEEGYDCVFGSRFLRGAKVSKYPLLKLAVNRVVNRCIQLLFWTRHNDLTNAFKAYRRHVIEECGPYRASHFNITLEMSLGALVRKYSVARMPVSWCGRTWGSSKLKLREMGRRYLSVLLKVFFERILIADDLMAERLSQRAAHHERMGEIQRRVEELDERLEALEHQEEAEKSLA